MSWHNVHRSSIIERVDENAPSSLQLDRGQKIAIALLMCISVLLVVAVIFQFRTTIYSYGARVSRTGVTPIVNDQERVEKERAALKQTDTDGDGLSDYDELSVFRTSPYIADTDSDGTRDGDEIKRGTSPNCPEGKDCSINPLVTGTTTTVASSTTSEPQDLLGLTPKDIREALVASGVPADKVSILTDEQLMQFVREAQAEYNASSTAP